MSQIVTQPGLPFGVSQAQLAAALASYTVTTLLSTAALDKNITSDGSGDLTINANNANAQASLTVNDNQGNQVVIGDGARALFVPSGITSLDCGQIQTSGLGTMFFNATTDDYSGAVLQIAGAVSFTDGKGSSNQIINQDGSIGIGAAATASGAIVLGVNATGSGGSAVAIGYAASASNGGAVAIGGNASASGQYSVAIGLASSASASYAVAIGRAANASVAGSVVFGGTANTTNITWLSMVYSSSQYHYNLPHLPTGTLASPPANLNVGDLFLDTTTSSQYPIVRMRAS